MYSFVFKYIWESKYWNTGKRLAVDIISHFCLKSSAFAKVPGYVIVLVTWQNVTYVSVYANRLKNHIYNKYLNGVAGPDLLYYFLWLTHDGLIRQISNHKNDTFTCFEQKAHTTVRRIFTFTFSQSQILIWISYVEWICVIVFTREKHYCIVILKEKNC